MIGQAWVLRCDSCGKVEMVYTKHRGLAVQTAGSHGWTINGKYCYCKACTKKRLGRTL